VKSGFARRGQVAHRTGACNNQLRVRVRRGQPCGKPAPDVCGGFTSTRRHAANARRCSGGACLNGGFRQRPLCPPPQCCGGDTAIKLNDTFQLWCPAGNVCRPGAGQCGDNSASCARRLQSCPRAGPNLTGTPRMPRPVTSNCGALASNAQDVHRRRMRERVPTTPYAYSANLLRPDTASSLNDTFSNCGPCVTGNAP